MTPTVAAVIVTYNPEESELEALLESLRPQVDFAVIVDNGSANSRGISRLAGQFSIDLLELGENQGIAGAQNRGIVYVLNKGAQYVLLSDQDSVPAHDMVEILLSTFLEAQTTDSETLEPIAAVGPVPVDERGNAEHALVYSFTTWGPHRDVIPQPGQVEEVPFVLASGSLLSRRALLDVGPMNESLFIDHVDLAWCLRAIEKGYRILVNGSAHLTHSLGEDKATLPWGREIHTQSPTRNYYMVRNTLFLERAAFMPLTWKVGYLSYLAKYLGFYGILGIAEPTRLRQLGRGLRDGLLGRSGK